MPRSFLLRDRTSPGGTRRKGNILADFARDPRAYELMAVFVPELSDEELVEQLERVTGYITDQNGTISEVLRESPWGRRRLAYTVRFNSVDYRDGIYVVYHFDSIPSVMTEIERELKLDVRVMRYLLVHDDPLAGEKDTGQNLEGDEAAAEGAEGVTAPDATPSDADASATSETVPADAPATSEAVSAANEAPTGDVAASESTEVESNVAVTPDAAPEEAAPVVAEPEPASTEEAPAETEPEVETPASDPKATEEETKED